MTTQCLSTFDVTTSPKVRSPSRLPAFSWADIAAIVITGAGFILLLPVATVIMALVR